MPKIAFLGFPKSPIRLQVAQGKEVAEATIDDDAVTANQPPVAGDDTAIVTAGESTTIAVLSNDADPEGGALTVVSATADQGSAVANADNTVTYTAPQNYSGAATVIYTIQDPAGNSTRGAVVVTVAAPAPPPTGDGQITRTQDYEFGRQLVAGEMVWFLHKRGSQTTNSKYSHPAGIASVQRHVLVAADAAADAAQDYTVLAVENEWFQHVNGGEVLRMRDIVTSKGTNPAVAEFISQAMVVEHLVAPGAFTKGDVLIEDSPSVDGNELKLTINSWPAAGNCQLSHAEYSTDGGSTWKRADHYVRTGPRTMVVPVGYSGDILLRAVNRLGGLGAVYTYTTAPKPTVGRPSIVIAPVRGDVRPSPAVFPFQVVEAWGFGVERLAELKAEWTWPAEASGMSGRWQSPGFWDDPDTYQKGLVGTVVIDMPWADFSGAASIKKTVSCKVSRVEDPAVNASTTYEVTVQNPELHFTNFFAISNQDTVSGDWSMFPTGARRFNDWAAAFQAARTSANSLIMFNRGETYETSTYRNPNETKLQANSGDVYVVAVGTGTPPVIYDNGLTFDANITGNTALCGIDWINRNYDPSAPWNPPSGTFDPGSAVEFKPTTTDVQNSDKIGLIYDCKMENYGTAVDLRDGTYGLAFVGTYITGWQNYGVQQGSAGHMFYVFSEISQKPNAVRSGGGKDGATANKAPYHGPIRNTRAEQGPFQFYMTRVFSSTSHGNVTGAQPCIRLSRADERGVLIVVDRLIADYGIVGIGTGEEYDDHAANDLVIDDTLLIVGLSEAHTSHVPGMIARNTVIVVPDAPQTSASNGLILEGNTGIWPSDYNLATAFINPTLADMRVGANRGGNAFLPVVTRGGESWEALPNFGVTNPVYLAPVGTAVNPNGTLGAVTLDDVSNFDQTIRITPLFEGTYVCTTWRNDPPDYTVIVDKSYAQPPSPLYPPLADAEAALAADTPDVIPSHDFYGNLRSASPVRGAFAVGSKA